MQRLNKTSWRVRRVPRGANAALDARLLGSETSQGVHASLYSGLPPRTIAALQHGLGTGIADLFASSSVTEQDLRHDSGWSELNPIITELIALLR